MDLRVAPETVAEDRARIQRVGFLEGRVAGQAEDPRLGMREQSTVGGAVGLVAGEAPEVAVALVLEDPRPNC